MMIRMMVLTLVLAGVIGVADGSTWYLRGAMVIADHGTFPSLWDGTIAYTQGLGGAVMYWDGEESVYVYGPTTLSFEPANLNGTVGWRNFHSGTNDIYRWDGADVDNLTESPATDSDVYGFGNGDMIWSLNHTWLYHYDASAGEVVALGVQGEHPAMYETEDGTLTYAYQDPSTDEIKYFDGTTTITLGVGASYGAEISMWKDAIAWVGEGAGQFFNTAEIFMYRRGETHRVTNDDEVDGIEDSAPAVWNNTVIWTRYEAGSTPYLKLWDGFDTRTLEMSGGQHPSFRHGRVAWFGQDDLNLAEVHRVGDMNCDRNINLKDINAFVLALSSPENWHALFPGCPIQNGDVNQDGSFDLGDINAFSNHLALEYEPE